MNPGLIGAIAGSVVGIWGGVIGTWVSIRNTKSSRERRFVIKAAIACWVAVLLMLVLILTIPNPYKAFAGLPVWILLPFAIKHWNRKQMQIRKEDVEPVN